MIVMQGAHGMWELSVNKRHHVDMVEDLLEALVAQLANADLQVDKHSSPAAGPRSAFLTYHHTVSSRDQHGSVLYCMFKPGLQSVRIFCIKC